MLADTTVLVLSAVLAFLMFAAGSALRTQGDMGLALGNRDDLPKPTPISGRADRAANNMLESFVLFIAILAAVHFAGKANAQSELGANLYLWGRVAYWPVYLAGIKLVRTVAWFVALIGMGMMAATLW